MTVTNGQKQTGELAMTLKPSSGWAHTFHQQVKRKLNVVVFYLEVARTVLWHTANFSAGLCPRARELWSYWPSPVISKDTNIPLAYKYRHGKGIELKGLPLNKPNILSFGLMPPNSLQICSLGVLSVSSQSQHGLRGRKSKDCLHFYNGYYGFLIWQDRELSRRHTPGGICEGISRLD